MLSLKTVWMKEYRFLSTRADDLKKLLVYMLTGLRQRSRYAIAMRNFQDDNCESFCFALASSNNSCRINKLGFIMIASEDEQITCGQFALLSKCIYQIDVMMRSAHLA